jgi:hypothetical protein
MEKLLSKQHENKTNHVINLTGHPTKNIFLNYGGYRKYFLPQRIRNILLNLIQDVLS